MKNVRINLWSFTTVKLQAIRLCRIAALAAVIGFSLAGCRSMQISGIEVAQRASAGASLGTFDINVRIDKFLGYSAGTTLFNLTSEPAATDPKIIDAIKDEIKRLGGSKAINVKIEYKADVFHVLLNAITLGIYAPAVVNITGTVIK